MRSFVKVIVTVLTFTFAAMADITMYVGPNGSDNAAGTQTAPLKTINAALSKMPKDSNENKIIIMRAGTYHYVNGIQINSFKNLTIKAASNETVTIQGGIDFDITQLQKITSEDITLGIPSAYANDIRKLNLQSAGIVVNDLWNENLLSQPVLPGLYYGGTQLQLSRWPDKDYAIVTGLSETSNQVFLSANNSPFNSTSVQHGLALMGYWYWDWYANYIVPDSFDKTKNALLISKSKSPYGFRAGQRFYAINLLSELNKPGTWAIDPLQGIIYVWLPSGNSPKLTITTNSNPLLQINKCSNITIQDVRFTITIADAIEINTASNIRIHKCEISNTLSNGITLSNCTKSIIEQNIIKNVGSDAISCDGGSVDDLVKADNYIVGNTITNWGTIKKSYSAAVWVGGAGNNVLYNSMCTAPHHAVQIHGNSHLIAFNDITDVCRDAQDMGIIYTGRDWTARGVIISQNYLHASGTGDVSAVYLDDMESGTVVENNLIENVPTALKLGGGRDNQYRGNTMTNCTYWIEADNRGMAKTFSDFGTLNERLVTKSYKTAPWTTTFPALQFILDDSTAIPKGNIILKNIIVGNQKSSIEKEIPQYGIVDSNQTVNSIADAEAILKKKNFGFVGKDKVGAKAYTPGMYASIKKNFRQPLLPILQKTIVSSDKVTFIFASTTYLNKMKIALTQSSTKADLQKLHTSSAFDTVTFKTASGEMIMRARYTGIEGVLDTDFIEYQMR
jgi:hypothetical protein